VARTLDLYQLISQPESYRDDEWERAFLESIREAEVEFISEEPQNGPDGWPYLYVKTSATGHEPISRVIGWLSERGIGLAINPHKMMPDYIFTYGMIWHFRETGQFILHRDTNPEDKVTYKKEEKWLFGAPTEAYLPKYVRRVMREFFAAQKLTDVQILVATSEDFKQTDFLFSTESLGHPPASDQRRLAETISWFLPTHYSIVLASQEQLPKFLPL
jgi:hypothetical protein